MTVEEKKAYNNGFILGMASKGVVITSEGNIKAEEHSVWLNQGYVEVVL